MLPELSRYLLRLFALPDQCDFPFSKCIQSFLQSARMRGLVAMVQTRKPSYIFLRNIVLREIKYYLLRHHTQHMKEFENMGGLFRRKEIEEQISQEEDSLSVLRELEKEEISLMEEKRELLALKEKLQLKAKEKIEIMKRRIQALQSEVSELRHQCEELENSVSTN